MNKTVKIILSILAILLISGAVFWSVKVRKQQTASNNQNVVENQNDNQNQIEQNNNTKAIGTDNWKTYRNEEYGFELKYPPFLHLNDQSNTFGGSINFLDRDKTGGSLFSVSISITDVRILDAEDIKKMDSCVKLDKKEITFDDIVSSKATSSPTPQSAGSESLCFKKGDAYFGLSFWFGDLTGKNIITPYEKDIIDTFKFVN